MWPRAFPPNSCTKLPQWKLLIEEASSKGQWQDVLSHYHGLRMDGNMPVDPSSFPPVLKACAKLLYFKQGTVVQAHVVKSGFDMQMPIVNSTVNFYIKCGVIGSALSVFNSAVEKDSVSWNIMIHGCFEQLGYEEGLGLFKSARQVGFEANISTLVLSLQACRGLDAVVEGLIIHGYTVRSGLSSIVSIRNSLLSFYTNFEELKAARVLFDEMTERDVISWSVIISGYAQTGEAPEAFKLFKEMCSLSAVKIDGIAMVSILQACSSSSRDKDKVMVIHGQAISRGFEFDVFVGNSLIDVYSKCFDIDSALKVFNKMSHCNDVSWNSILSGLVHNERHEEATELFDMMKKAGIEADGVTLVILLKVCGSLGGAVWCRCIHSFMLRRALEMNELVLCSLLDGYSKCEMVGFAWKLFLGMKKRILVSWSIMIKSLAQHGMSDEAIDLFVELMLTGEEPNLVSMLSLIEACSVSAKLEKSRWAHGKMTKTGFEKDIAIGTAILEMYAKCGDIDSSRVVFEEMPERNLVSWSAMIAACGMNGHPDEAITLFREMKTSGIQPNEVTVLSVLSACSHGGLVEEGLSIFEEMIRNYGFKPRLEHYSCMVDMFGRAKKLESVVEVMKKMPKDMKPGASLWSTFLSACRECGNSELGQLAAAHVLELEPLSSAGYILASSMYLKEGFWNLAAGMRRVVKEKGVKVLAGYSLVHVGHRQSKFVAGDRSHPQSMEIYTMVEGLHACIKEEDKDEIP